MNAGAQKKTVLGPVNHRIEYESFTIMSTLKLSARQFNQILTYFFTCCMIPQWARRMPWFWHYFIGGGYHWWVNFACHCVFFYYSAEFYLRFTVPQKFFTKIFTLPICSTFCALLTLFPIRLAHYLLSSFFALSMPI